MPTESSQLAYLSEERAGRNRVAFVTISLSGHKRLAIALAAETSKRGYSVDFLMSESGVTTDLRELERQGSPFTVHSLTKGADMAERIDWGSVASSTGRLGGSRIKLFEELARVAEYTPLAIERAQEIVALLSKLQPDVVVVDHSQMVVREWAEEHGMPTIVLHTPYFATGEPTGCAVVSEEAQAKLAEFMKTHNPMGKLLASRTALGLRSAAEGDGKIPEGAKNARKGEGLAPHTFVFCEPELLNEVHVPSRVHVVGPCLEASENSVDEHLLPWLQDANTCGDRVLYVAFGTLANGFLTPATVGTLLDAFSQLGQGWRVLWSLPKAQQHLLAESGRNWDTPWLRIESFVRQRGVLSHPAVQVFLSHGGQSSVNEAIFAGKPLICMPLFCDQYEVSEAVRKHGLGLVFHKDELLDEDCARLAGMILRSSSEPKIQAMSQRYGRLMRLRAGCRRGVEVIESIIHAGVDFQELWQGQPQEKADKNDDADTSPVMAAVGGA